MSSYKSDDSKDTASIVVIIIALAAIFYTVIQFAQGLLPEVP